MYHTYFSAEEKDNFIDRQEAKYRQKTEKLSFNIGKANYDAILDKKSCSSCGAKQSYDEYKKKQKKCQNCNVEYKSQLTWGKVAL